MAVLDLRGENPVQDLTQAFLRASGRTDLDKHYGIYFVHGDDEYAPLAKMIEREVFNDWFANDEAIMDAEYNHFDATSDFVLCIDHERCEPAGTIRVIRPSEVGLKTLIDLEAEPRWGLDPDTVIAHHPCPSGLGGTHDIATLAVRPDWSGGSGLRISHALYCGLYRWALGTGIEQFVGMLDLTPVELVRSIGIGVHPLCGLPALEYLGSPATMPVLISVIETVAAMRVDPVLRDLLSGAAALDQFSMPPITLSGSWASVEGVPGAQPASDGDHIQL